MKYLHKGNKSNHRRSNEIVRVAAGWRGAWGRLSLTGQNRPEGLEGCPLDGMGEGWVVTSGN